MSIAREQMPRPRREKATMSRMRLSLCRRWVPYVRTALDVGGGRSRGRSAGAATSAARVQRGCSAGCSRALRRASPRVKAHRFVDVDISRRPAKFGGSFTQSRLPELADQLTVACRATANSQCVGAASRSLRLTCSAAAIARSTFSPASFAMSASLHPRRINSSKRAG
jgi:hypothetical protein